MKLWIYKLWSDLMYHQNLSEDFANVWQTLYGVSMMECRAYDNGQSPDIFQPIQIWPDKFLYIINGNFIEFAKNNKCLDNFGPYRKHCERYNYDHHIIIIIVSIVKLGWSRPSTWNDHNWIGYSQLAWLICNRLLEKWLYTLSLAIVTIQ